MLMIITSSTSSFFMTAFVVRAYVRSSFRGEPPARVPVEDQDSFPFPSCLHVSCSCFPSDQIFHGFSSPLFFRLFDFPVFPHIGVIWACPRPLSIMVDLDFFAPCKLVWNSQIVAGEISAARWLLCYKNPDSDSNLAIFSSSLSRGSTCKLRSYISCTSPALCMFLRM